MLLLLLILIPTLGAAIGALLPRTGGAARWWAFWVSIATLLVAVLMACQFDWAGGRELTFGIDGNNAFYLYNIKFGVKLGADAITMWLVLLTALLQPVAVAASFKAITDRQKQYYAWMTALLAAMVGVFVARDLLLFYIFFELTLIPMFFIIGIWGGPERRYAAGKFFLFTFSGSVFTLAGIIYIGLVSPRGFDLYGAYEFAQQLPPTVRYWLLLAFLAGFAVKVPLFPVHTWLPLAHTEAPTAGSVILAGVLLKLGTYGILKIALPIGLLGADLNAVLYSGHFLGVLWSYTITLRGLVAFIGCLCVIGVIYGALVAWVQRDVKKLVAYSSVSHLGFCVLGLFALNMIGVQGSVLYMINHGLSTGALFLCVGMFYDRYHTRDIDELSGLARVMPKWAFFMVLFALSSIGLPGLNGFASEFLTILGAFTSTHLGIAFGSFAALGIILGAVYMLHMVARIVFGPLKTPGAHGGHGHQVTQDHGVVPTHGQADSGQGASPGGNGGHDFGGLPQDLSGRELGILIPLALAVVILGVRPNLVLQTIDKPVQQMVQVQEKNPATPAVALAK